MRGERLAIVWSTLDIARAMLGQERGAASEDGDLDGHNQLSGWIAQIDALMAELLPVSLKPSRPKPMFDTADLPPSKLDLTFRYDEAEALRTLAEPVERVGLSNARNVPAGRLALWHEHPADCVVWNAMHVEVYFRPASRPLSDWRVVAMIDQDRTYYVRYGVYPKDHIRQGFRSVQTAYKWIVKHAEAIIAASRCKSEVRANCEPPGYRAHPRGVP